MAIRDRLKKECRCNPSGYKLNKIKKMNPVVYSVDCMYGDESATRCDEVVICDLDVIKTGIYLIERKRNNPSMAVVEQLRSCARFVERKLKRDEKFDFMPVLVSDKIRPATYQKMRKEIICIHDIEQKIKRIRTGASLDKIEA